MIQRFVTPHSSVRTQISIARCRIVTLFLSVLLVSSEVSAQDQVWSMNECMKYALENSPKVKKQYHTDDTYKAEVTAAVASFFPSLSVGSQGTFNFGRSIDPKTNTYNTVSTFNNSYSLSASMPLFDGGQLVNQLRSAKIKRNIGAVGIEKEKDDLSLNVMQSYIDVLYYTGTVDLAAERLSESQRVLHKTKRQEELGIKGKADVVQIESQVAANDYNLTRQQNLLNTALLTLKTHMNFPSDSTFQIDTLFSSLVTEKTERVNDEIYEYATEHNPTARLATLRLKNAEMQHLVSKGRMYPTISVDAGVSTNYFRNLSSDQSANGTPIDPFVDQMKNNLGEYVGIRLSIPLFSGLSRVTNVRRARNERHIAREEQNEVFRQLQNAIDQAIFDREGYAKEVAQMEKKVEADDLSYQITLRKFEEGLMSPLDLQLSSNNLLLAKAELLQRRLALVIKSKLVDYYCGIPLVTK